MSTTDKIFTLKQVVQSIRKTIEERYQNTYWVKAEMHKLNRYPSGHCFPELLQKENGKIVAQIGASIWKHNFDRINENFIKVVKEPIKEDTTLLMKVKIAFHENYGLSLQILDIDPNYALGELQRERQETLLKLKKEGIINANQQLNFPLLPKRVAVISAESSKGLNDFYQVLEGYSSRYSLFHMLFPSYLQGDQAASSIIAQLNRINRVKGHFDLVVIVRGGGGEVGLSCYNNYELCKTIATFPLPVLTGIGHSTNFTVAEMIAFRNAITPTELADFLINSFKEFELSIDGLSKDLRINTMRQLERSSVKLTAGLERFKNTTTSFLNGERARLRSQGETLKFGSKQLVRENINTIQLLVQNLNSRSRQYTDRGFEKVEQLKLSLQKNSAAIIKHQNEQVLQLEKNIRLVDPINVLKRGYSITTINGKVVRKADDLNEGDLIETLTEELRITSEVRSNNKRNE